MKNILPLAVMTTDEERSAKNRRKAAPRGGFINRFDGIRAPEGKSFFR